MNLPHTSAAAARLDIAEATGSTNADLLADASDAAAFPHFSVRVTDDQRAGRGRLDREWTAPAGSAVAVSVLLRDLEIAPDQRGWIPLAAGAAMAEAVAAQLPDARVGVKWPNDVLVDGQKICGILAEAAGTGVIVIGAGVNTEMTAEQLPVPTATSFRLRGVTCDVDLLLAGYLARLDAHLTGLAEHGTAIASGLRRSVSACCLTIGQPVTAHLPGGGELRGEAVRLAADGQLVLQTEDGEASVAAGDIVHLRPAS